MPDTDQWTLISEHWLNNHCAGMLFGRQSHKPLLTHMFLTMVSACLPLATKPDVFCEQLDMVRRNIEGLKQLQWLMMTDEQETLLSMAKQVSDVEVTIPPVVH